MISDLIKGNNLEETIRSAILDIHTNGPVNAEIFEKLSYIKKYHQDRFSPFEKKIVHLMGLFYKNSSPRNITEEVYSIFSDAIKEETGHSYTPVQSSAYQNIKKNKYFSFSAPTSMGKSYLFREILREYKNDVVVVVPSRALISEYILLIRSEIDKNVLLLQFVDDLNTENTDRRIYVITHERGNDLFRLKNELKIGLFLFDEAQISEEDSRGLTFDAFVRRVNSEFPQAKKIFSHPFIDNPEAQLHKHKIDKDANSHIYKQHSVGKIFLSHKDGKFDYFSPYFQTSHVPTDKNIPLEIIKSGGTALIFISKKKIYSGEYSLQFESLVSECSKETNPAATELIEQLRQYIGASKTGEERHSHLLDMMARGIVVHHGSMPLKARLIIERFIKEGFAKLCFATSTLNQGINMPFDVVWIDNFHNLNTLSIKNLIGRAGRTTQKEDCFDYGFTIVNKKNVSTFKSRMSESYSISEKSKIDANFSDIMTDQKDLVEAVKEDNFNDELRLPQQQVDRISEQVSPKDIKIITDNLIKGGTTITAEEYYKLPESVRKKIKSSFKEIYISHLRRKELKKSEVAVLSSAIPIMLWRIQGKSFSEIVSQRYSFLSERDRRRTILAMARRGVISSTDAKEQLDALTIRYSPVAASLPNERLSGSPLFPTSMSVNDIDFDTVVYDTYDYLDKVVSLSLSDPICASLELYYRSTQDENARVLQNFIRYGTNNETEIWLLRYGIDAEDIDWLLPHIKSVDSSRIVFSPSIADESPERKEVVARYL